MCSDKRLIYCCCLTTVSTEIAILAANSASGPSFAAVCVANAAILYKYPSIKPIIWLVSGGVPAVFWCSLLHSCSLDFQVQLRIERNHQKVFLPPPGQLWRVASQRKPPGRSFSMPTRFLGLPGVLTTPVSPSCTHRFEAAILAPQRAYTCHEWRVLHAWIFAALLPWR